MTFLGGRLPRYAVQDCDYNLMLLLGISRAKCLISPVWVKVDIRIVSDDFLSTVLIIVLTNVNLGDLGSMECCVISCSAY